MMDPNEALKKLRELAASGMAQAESMARSLDEFSDLRGGDLEMPPEFITLGDLATAVQSLDAWLVRGGFLPQDWEVKK